MERDRDEALERRGGAGQRVRFEALVAVGETSGGGFEAESIDMSPEGMRLRTAYLPKVGDALICRFDGLGKELVVEGEVCWRAEQARGGEFGLRFTNLDAAAEAAVRAMCDVMHGSAAGAPGIAAPAGAPPAAQSTASRGARVRLHIDGLGSPMKARVRAGGLEDLEVGSNLEFLKVGRSLELEEVEHGSRREAYIDHVKVEIDPATSVPQLVVTLRYDAPRAPRAARAPSRSAPPASPHPARPAAAAPAAAPAATSAAAPAAAAPAPARRSSPPPHDPASDDGVRAGAAPADAVDDEPDGDASPSHAAQGPDAAPRGASGAGEPQGQEEPGATPSEASAAAQANRLRDAGEKAAKVVAGRVGPALAGAGGRAKAAMAGVLARIRKRRAALAEGEGAGAKEGGVRRTTAPPPAGALKSEGRRLVREEADAPAGDAPPGSAAAAPFNKKAAALGSFLGLAAVLVVFGAARLLGLRGEAAASRAEGAEAAPALPAASSSAAALPAAAAGAARSTPGGALTANVPLFGATPLSTTEPVPPPPDPRALAGDAPEADAMPGGPGEEDEPDVDDEQDAPKEFGQGVVRSPVVLKLKMDGPIEELNGAAGAMGFTVSLPDRRALSSGTGLARKDKRIASVRVVNTPHGAEITLQFKDGVPPYKAKARGNRLEIALGRDEPKKVASKAKKSKKDDAGDDSKKKGERSKEKGKER